MSSTTKTASKLTVARIGDQWGLVDSQTKQPVGGRFPSRNAARAALAEAKAQVTAEVEAARAEPDPEPTGTKPTAAEAGAHVAAKKRTERLKLAEAEHATLRAWMADGGKGDPPATPNLDAIEAETSITPRTATGGKARVASTPKAPKVEPKGLKDAPAPGTKLTDEQVVKLIAANPTASWSTLTNHLRAKGWSCSNARFRKVMATVPTATAKAS